MTEALLIIAGLVVAVIVFRNRGRTPPSRAAGGQGTSKAARTGAARSQPRQAPPQRGMAGLKAAWRAQLAAVHRAVGIIVFVLVIYFLLIFIREFL